MNNTHRPPLRFGNLILFPKVEVWGIILFAERGGGSKAFLSIILLCDIYLISQPHLPHPRTLLILSGFLRIYVQMATLIIAYMIKRVRNLPHCLNTRSVLLQVWRTSSPCCTWWLEPQYEAGSDRRRESWGPCWGTSWPFYSVHSVPLSRRPRNSAETD